MFFFKRFSKRLIMTILFVGAIITTFETVSGLNVKTLASNAQLHEGKTKQTSQIPFKNRFQFLLPLPSLYESVQKYSNLTYTAIATAQTATFEEAEDWSKYPTKNVTATGYTAGVESTGKNPGHPLYGITYSGVKVKRDLYSTIAADPNVFPIGTILFIPGYGYGVVADTGSVIKGNIIDLYYDTVEEVYSEWGKKTLDVYVIKEGNGKITEEELTALNEAEAVQVFRQGFLKKNEKE